ncbi:3-oxo-tetronate kinase [Pelagibacterium lacus]|uniref:3-oxo-tetronate kinase n=1 Tax=Pelagibacterium lacus TaxID=2282655 RepID=A0A369W1B9_9HYPH|nr:3-oxo-tetronate kinase [Pelagibacterium lacus]RDE08476.1 four-carbon acid sugar kinase family protein [Pelagibacterium lacus]
MLLGVIADDFTGASDIANTIAKGIPGQGGLATAQYMGVPAHRAPESVEAGVVSLKSRSIPVAEAVEQSLAALAWLREQGCQQIVFKYCSTFDSTREGNIGPVGEALAEALGAKGVVVCPAFPGAGRTIYQGHLFVHDKLLSESGMQNHPLTPMTDPDIRRWLGYQTRSDVGHVALPTVLGGPEAIAAALAQAGGAGATMVVVDAVDDDNLIAIGRACAGAPLVTGGSGIAMALGANFIDRGLASGQGGAFTGLSGPEAIIAGSCSGATRGQIDRHALTHPVLNISVDSVMAGETEAGDLADFLSRNAGKAPLVYSSATPQEVAATQARYGREAVAHKLDTLFADTARQLVDKGVKRLVVAGGETSGAVAQALDLGDLVIGPEIDPGVPVLISRTRDVVVALKSGNFGGEDFFTKALDVMENGQP